MIRNWVKYCTNGCYQWTHSVFVKHIYCTSSCSWVIGVRFLGPISWRWELSKPKSTKILFLAPSRKYHLSNGPLSRGRLIPRLVGILFFSVSPVFTTGLVTDIYPTRPLFGVCVISFSPWSRVLSFSFRVYHSVLISRTVCTVLMSQ